MNNHLRHIFLPVFVGFVIFAGTCLLNSSDVPEMPQGIPWDKVAHFGMFFVLSAVCLFDYYRLHNGSPNLIKWMGWGFLLPVLYGGAIELMQKYFFPSRSAEWGDFIADVLGSFFAACIAIIYLIRKRSSKKNISL